MLTYGTPLALWMIENRITRLTEYVSVGSPRNKEWQTLAFQPAVEREVEGIETYAGSLVSTLSTQGRREFLSRSERRAEDVKDPKKDRIAISKRFWSECTAISTRFWRDRIAIEDEL